MDENSPKIIALLSKIERNTGKLISLMVGTGNVGAGVTKAVAPSVAVAAKAVALKSETSKIAKSGKAILASRAIPKPATLPNPADTSRRGEGKGGQVEKTPSKIASKAIERTRQLPARDEKGRFVKRPIPVEQVKPVKIMNKPDKTGNPDKPVPAVGKSQRALDVRRRKKEAVAERAGLAKIFGKVLKTSSKIALAGAKGFILSQQLRTGGNALGFTAGGAFWAGMQELVEAGQVARDSRIIQAIGDKWSNRKSKQKADAETPKGGAVRDNKGRFIRKAKAVPAITTNAKGQASLDAPAQKAKALTLRKRLERKSDRQHRELIKAVEGVGDGGSDSALMNFLPRLTGPIAKMGKLLGKVLGIFSKGPAKAIAGAAGLAGSAAAIGGKALGKVPILGKVLPGAAKAAAPALGKTGGKMLAKTGAKTVGKSILKKIPAIGLLAGAGFAIHRLTKGDVLGAIAELGSGAVSLVPGIGTAASLAIDAGLAARDIKAEHDKDLKLSLKKDSESATIPETAPRPAQVEPATVEVQRVPDPAPIKAEQAITVKTLTQAFEAALTRVLNRDRGTDRANQKKPYHIPTDFDEPLLVLMAHDRI